MRCPVRVVPLVAALLLVAEVAGFPAPDDAWAQHTAGLPFVIGLDRGREESKFTGRPAMLFFTSATDEGCPLFAARTWKDADVLAKVAGYTPVLVDFDTADPALKTKYKVEMVPSLVWLDHDEKWLYACYGDAPIDIVRKEAEIARARCPAPREPAEGFKTLQELKKKLDDAAQAKDVKAQFAAIAEIRKVRLGEAVQQAAVAASARLTREGLEAVERNAAIYADKKAAPTKRTEARKALDALIVDYGAEHEVAVAAKAAIDNVLNPPKPKK